MHALFNDDPKQAMILNNGYIMSNTNIHTKISNLLQLIEINNNRMALNPAMMDLDIVQMRAHVLELYTCIDQLEINKKTSGSITTPLKEDFIETVSKNDSPKPEKKVERVEEVEKEIKEELNIQEKPKFIPQVETKKQPVPEVVEAPRREDSVEDEIKEVKKEVTEVKEETSKPKISNPFKTDKVEVENKVVEVEKAIEPEPSKVEEDTPSNEPSIEPKKTETPPTVKTAKSANKPEAGDIYSKLQYSKLESIKRGISISKRYEIQNELFKNNSEFYNSAITQLDTALDLNEAFNVLDEKLTPEYGWDPENDLVEELRTLLIRRYI